VIVVSTGTTLADDAETRLTDFTHLIASRARIGAASDDARRRIVALLGRSGLRPALRSLARRSPIIVDVDVVAVRLPEQIETAVYHVVSEALANATKHAIASEVSISVDCTESDVRAAVTDDSVGGAAIGGGTGLSGLVDRVEALGGRFTWTARTAVAPGSRSPCTTPVTR
jgi:signal transduction histidine kinase